MSEEVALPSQRDQQSVPIAAFDQGRVSSHLSIWLYARALSRLTGRLGIRQQIVFYKPGKVADGFINEVQIKGRLSPSQWEDIAVWSRRYFPQLHFGRTIRDRLARYNELGSSPDDGVLNLQGL